MDIDFQLGNQAFSLLRLIIGAGAFGVGLWILMDLFDAFIKKTPKTRLGQIRFWKRLIIKGFVLLLTVVFFTTVKSNAPRVTIDYPERQAVQPQGEVSPDSKAWRENWQDREKRMRELDKETDERTLDNDE